MTLLIELGFSKQLAMDEAEDDVLRDLYG